MTGFVLVLLLVLLPCAGAEMEMAVRGEMEAHSVDRNGGAAHGDGSGARDDAARRTGVEMEAACVERPFIAGGVGVGRCMCAFLSRQGVGGGGVGDLIFGIGDSVLMNNHGAGVCVLGRTMTHGRDWGSTPTPLARSSYHQVHSSTRRLSCLAPSEATTYRYTLTLGEMGASMGAGQSSASCRTYVLVKFFT
ncbi:hypothetical protein BV22DRAFT_1047027 [Leucogyrophana mollusca]|uniref:Uncharacterized protein n=1 Tax=Leucogyrophana mollusca TaxID=85980 RepID=A0ACB8BGQ4_9AGAM|nr:hypothetical protein BV22DRAFT_1047027 [Leucogyrophana mollusca]